MSDVHGAFNSFMPTKWCDAIIVAGDFTNFRRNGPAELERALAWFNALSQIAPVYFVPGNHDIGINEEALLENAKVQNVLNKTFLVCGNAIGGASLSPCYGMPALASRWAHMTCNEQAEQSYYESIEPCNILVSHSPPAGQTGEDKYWGQLGSKYLLNWIETHQPALVVCGHIHEPISRIEYIDNTRVINVATELRYVTV